MLPASSTDYTALLAGTDERWNAMSGDGAPVFITYTFATSGFEGLFGNSADFGITDFGAFSDKVLEGQDLSERCFQRSCEGIRIRRGRALL